MAAGDLTNPKRARTQANERLDTVDTEALSAAPRSLVDAYGRAITSSPRAAGGTSPTGLIFNGFGLTLNPTAPSDAKVRVQSAAGVALDSDGRMLVKEAGTTTDLTLSAGNSQIYAYFVETQADTTTRRFISVTSPYVEGPDAIPTTLKGGVSYLVRAGDQTSIVASAVVNGKTTALCFLGVANNTAGTVTMTGYDATSAPNGAYAVNRLSAVVAPGTVPPANTANGSIVSITDAITAALYSVGNAMWKGSTALTPAAANDFGAYQIPTQGVQKVKERVDLLAGAQTITFLFDNGDYIAGPSASHVAGTPGITIAANAGDAYFKLPHISNVQRLLKVEIFIDGGATGSCSLKVPDNVGPFPNGPYLDVIGATNIGIGPDGFTLQPTTPVAGGVYVLKTVQDPFVDVKYMGGRLYYDTLI